MSFRFRDVAVFCVLNESCACWSIEKDDLFKRIRGPLSPLRIREVMGRLAYLNLLIKDRPRFHSEFFGGSYQVSSTHPDFTDLDEKDPKPYGEVLYRTCVDCLSLCHNLDNEVTKEYVLAGRYSFLFDNDGAFIEESMRLGRLGT